jgi:translation initiation factor 2 gamma subunit (eIF-2gamma)
MHQSDTPRSVRRLPRSRHPTGHHAQRRGRHGRQRCCLSPATRPCPQPQTSEHLGGGGDHAAVKQHHHPAEQDRPRARRRRRRRSTRPDQEALSQGTVAGRRARRPHLARSSSTTSIVVCEYIIEKIPVPARDFHVAAHT